MSQIQ